MTHGQRPSEFEKANKALRQWYIRVCSKNIFPGGPQLTGKTKAIAMHAHSRTLRTSPDPTLKNRDN